MPRPEKAKPYQRHYHNTKATKAMLQQLPGWMKMRNDQDSAGYQFMNAAVGMEAQRIDELIVESLANQYPTTADPNEPWRLYETTHDTKLGTIPFPDFVTASGTLHDGRVGQITLVEVDDVFDLFRNPPTRIYPASRELTKILEEDDFSRVVYDDPGLWTDSGGVMLFASGVCEQEAATPFGTARVQAYNSSIAFSTFPFDQLDEKYYSIEAEVTVGAANGSAGVYMRETTTTIPVINPISRTYSYNYVVTSNANRDLTKVQLYISSTFLDTLLLWEKNLDTELPGGTPVKLRLDAESIENNNVRFTMYLKGGTASGVAPTGDPEFFARYIDSEYKLEGTTSPLIQGHGLINIFADNWGPGDTYIWDNWFLRIPQRENTIDFSEFFDENITAFSYIRNYDPSGVLDAQEAYLVGVDKDTEDTSNYNTYIIASSGVPSASFSTDLYHLHGYNYGRIDQNYDNIGSDEILAFVSGVATLEETPIEATFSLHDMLNLDSNKDATIVPASSYVLDRSAKTVTWVTPTTRRSQYFAEYQYPQYRKANYVTTTSSFWNNQTWGTGPLFSTSSTDDYTGSAITVEDAYTAYPSGRLLVADPLELRPGSIAKVSATFPLTKTGVWTYPSGTTLTINMDHPLFVSTNPEAVHLSSAAGPVVTRDRFRPQVSGSVVTIPALLHDTWAELDYTVYFNAELDDYEVVSEASLASSGTAHAYQDDWIIVNQMDPINHRRQDFVHPMTAIPLVHPSGDVNLALQQLDLAKLTITTDLSFKGIAYDKDQHLVWLLEQNNFRLHSYDPDNGSIVGQYNIFKPNRFSTSYNSSIAISGSLMPYVPHDRPSGVILGGMVYLNDFLYILDTADAQIYRINTFDHYNMDREYDLDGNEVYPPFTFPSGVTPADVTDITVDRNNNFLVAEGQDAKSWVLGYDYYIVDQGNAKIFYREKYDTIVEIALPRRHLEPDRGDL